MAFFNILMSREVPGKHEGRLVRTRSTGITGCGRVEADTLRISPLERECGGAMPGSESFTGSTAGEEFDHAGSLFEQ